MPVPKPSWFRKDKILVCTAPTCGLSRGGRYLKKIDPDTGTKIQVVDPDTKELIDAVDDRLLSDMDALSQGLKSESLRYVDRHEVSLRCAVPIYYDRSFHHHFLAEMQTAKFAGFSSATLGELIEEGKVCMRGGHGSPSHDERVGEVPYIKVSDLRAGFININPTNRVPRSVAEKMWKGGISGLRAFDLICPERTSKNIGDFCLLMPGQEQIVMTKEMIVLRCAEAAGFDQFYLLWALSLKIVRDQWKRIIFMQTNREDVGKRYLEIEIPVPPSAARGMEVSQYFREYYLAIAEARTRLSRHLQGLYEHHFFVSGAEADDADGAAIVRDLK